MEPSRPATVGFPWAAREEDLRSRPLRVERRNIGPTLTEKRPSRVRIAAFRKAELRGPHARVMEVLVLFSGRVPAIAKVLLDLRDGGK